MAKYAYTASPGKTSDDKFEVEKLKKGEAELRESDMPDRKAMRVMQGDSLSEFLNPKSGAGRGQVNPKQGKDYAKGGKVSSASSRADGCAVKGKTKGTIVGMKKGGMC